jgi:hypothetical protein
MRQAHILGQKVVRSQPQSRHRVQFAVPGGEENNGYFRRQSPQIPAQIETTLGLFLQGDVDDGKSGKWRLEGLHGAFPVAVGLDLVALARQRRTVILAQGRLILDDRNLPFHGPIIAIGGHEYRAGLAHAIIHHIWPISCRICATGRRLILLR